MHDSYTHEEMYVNLNDHVVTAISRDGRYAVIGEGDDNEDLVVYFFMRTELGWDKQAAFVIPQEAPTSFNMQVGISDDGSYVIVGDPCYDEDNHGAALIYARTGATWALEATLIADDHDYADYFGFSVSISAGGDYAVIGAHYKTGIFIDQGAVYIFARDGNTWSQQAKLEANDPAAFGFLGKSVSITSDGRCVIVAAYSQLGSRDRQAAVYVFMRSADTWTQEAKLLCNTALSGTLLYDSVSISSDGNYLSIAHSNKDERFFTQHIHSKVAGVWVERASLVHRFRADNDFIAMLQGNATVKEI